MNTMEYITEMQRSGKESEDVKKYEQKDLENLNKYKHYF